MDILSEIIEKADNIIELLSKTNFFNDYPFIDVDKFRYRLQVTMQYKWEQHEEINLTSKEFIHLVHLASNDGISDTIYEMSEKGLISMAVNPKGQLVYSASNTGRKKLNDKEKELLYIFTGLKRKQSKK